MFNEKDYNQYLDAEIKRLSQSGSTIGVLFLKYQLFKAADTTTMTINIRKASEVDIEIPNRPVIQTITSPEVHVDKPHPNKNYTALGMTTQITTLGDSWYPFETTTKTITLSGVFPIIAPIEQLNTITGIGLSHKRQTSDQSEGVIIPVSLNLTKEKPYTTLRVKEDCSTVDGLKHKLDIMTFVETDNGELDMPTYFYDEAPSNSTPLAHERPLSAELKTIGQSKRLVIDPKDTIIISGDSDRNCGLIEI